MAHSDHELKQNQRMLAKKQQLLKEDHEALRERVIQFAQERA
jgi:hypothetical protein